MSATTPPRPRFIVFEGPEGAGKTTQIERLKPQLPHAVFTREPGGTPGGEAIRDVLLRRDAEWSPLAEALMLAAARDAHVRAVIEPALKAQKTVICDRYADSTEAYQGAGGGLDDQVMDTLRGWVCRREPDVTLVFDLPVEQGLARAAARDAFDRFEAKGGAYHGRVRHRFRKIAERPGAVLIDADADADVVEGRVRRALLDRFPNLFGTA